MSWVSISDGEYSHIRVFAGESPKLGSFTINADLRRKTDKGTTEKKFQDMIVDHVDVLHFNMNVISDLKKPIPQEFYNYVLGLVSKKKVDYTITRNKEKQLLVDITQK